MTTKASNDPRRHRTLLAEPLYPCLYQINTRVSLTRLARLLGRAATLDDFPEAELDRLAATGFDWIWLLSVWQTGLAGQRISRANAGWRKEFQETLPDLREEDIGGSGFAITGYTVSPGLGGDGALARLRDRFRRQGRDGQILQAVPVLSLPEFDELNRTRTDVQSHNISLL